MQTVTRNDIAAMTWLRENAEQDAMLLAADGQGWLPVFAERRALDFRAVAFFEWDELRESGDGRDVDYVFQSKGSEFSADERWQLVFEQGDARVYEVVES